MEFCWSYCVGQITSYGCFRQARRSEVAQSCLTLCNPMNCSLPGSSNHGILQARILEWVAISFSRGSSQPRDRTRVSHIGGRRFNLEATREAPKARRKSLLYDKTWVPPWSVPSRPCNARQRAFVLLGELFPLELLGTLWFMHKENT